jgi:hypothetical protein
MRNWRYLDLSSHVIYQDYAYEASFAKAKLRLCL